MARSFDLLDYIERLRRRATLVVAAVAAAGVVTGGVSLTLPKQYRATVRILIQTPDGGPESSPTLMSPHYLASLGTYALIATGDELRARAEAELGVSGARVSASVPQNSRILEVRAELPDPRQALAMARLVAGETVRRAEEAVTGRESRETLSVIDPGIEPRGAVGPKPLFNAASAMLFALVAALLAVAIDLGLARDEG